MLKAFLPPIWPSRSSLGAAWLVGVIALLGTQASAQPPAKKAAEKASEKPDTADDAPVEKEATVIDRWEDPLAADALSKFPTVQIANSTPAEQTQIKAWANGQGQPDQAVIKRFVQSRIYQLADRKNLQALENLAGKSDDAKAIEKATSDLLEPLLVAQVSNNERFRTLYVGALIDSCKPIWKGNLHTRVEAMIVLSRSGHPDALAIFADQLSAADQLLIVKLLSAVGITTVARHGRKNIEGNQPVQAANALSDFLTSQPEAFWPAQFRGFEALGSLRLATPQPASGKAEFADVAMNYLTDPNASPQVQAWAAWSLGMMQIPRAVQNFNYALVAHAIGNVAAGVGDQMLLVADKSTPKMVRLADILLQINRAFSGEPEVNDSGFLRSKNVSYVTSQAYMIDIEKKIKDVTKLAVAMSQGAGTQLPRYREELAAKIKDLRSALSKPLPTGKAPLYTGGPSYPIAAPKVADGVRP